MSSSTGSIVPRHVVEKFGDDWIKPENFVSNGAYLLKAWIPNGGITLVRNPNYREPPSLDTVIFEPTDDIDAAVTRFRGGGLDMQFEFPSARTAELRRVMPAETKVEPATLTFYLTLNLRNPKFKDVRVRKALSLAIDRDLLVSKVLRGGETPLMTLVPPTIPGYRTPVVPEQSLSMPERLARARALLAEAGITPDHPLRFTYSHGANSDRKRIAVAIAAMWKPLGVVASLQGMEGKVLFSNLHEGDYEIGYLGGSADYPDAASFLTGQLSYEPSGNYARYNSPVYDGLVERAEEMADAKSRAEVLGQAETEMIKDQPIIPLFEGVTRELVAQYVHGWQPSPTAVHLSRYLSIDQTGLAPQ
jgi:oligopeptide transport system substrate-binding protein